jgi:hypothetical protein
MLLLLLPPLPPTPVPWALLATETAVVCKRRAATPATCKKGGPGWWQPGQQTTKPLT